MQQCAERRCSLLGRNTSLFNALHVANGNLNGQSLAAAMNYKSIAGHDWEAGGERDEGMGGIERLKKGEGRGGRRRQRKEGRS